MASDSCGKLRSWAGLRGSYCFSVERAAVTNSLWGQRQRLVSSGRSIAGVSVKKQRKPKVKRPEPRQVRLEELEEILERVRGALSTEDHDKLRGAIDTLAFLTQEIEQKGASIQRLRNLLFGPSTEKTSAVLGKSGAASQEREDGSSGARQQSGTHSDGTAGTGSDAAADEEAAKKRPGHGRNGALSYVGAKKIPIAHEQLHHKDRCPGCERGKLYVQTDPSRLTRVVAMAPLTAAVYELERLRCNLCGDVYTAAAPEGVGQDKYDESVSAMLALLRYGCGLPFHRLEWLETSLGIPLPQSTQWELCSEAASRLEPLHACLIEQAAQGDVLYNDDTVMKILKLDPVPQADAGQTSEPADSRTGIFTTGIISTKEGQRIALFFTGRKHAGENLAGVLAHRAADSSAAVQMCDALARNTSGEFQTIVANCLAHARRRFVEVASSFPEECRLVLESLGKVYRHDAQAREQALSAQQRLLFHQQRSGPVMDELHRWLDAQFDDKKVEPNSVLGKAIGYMLRHWDKLTLFLRQPGAPLDNNLCEQALKKAILHRKNSLFYKTQSGARVGDLFMSLIHTAELAEANPFDYLVAVQRHHPAVLEEPAAWMPWNYLEALKGLGAPLPEPRPP
jgi:transposase